VKWKESDTGASFEAFTAVMFQVEVLWNVIPCRVVVGYQYFSGPCCLHLQGEDLFSLLHGEDGGRMDS
jgi:hypothetical protein